MLSKDRFKAVISVYLILQRSDEVLLLLRQNTGFEDGKYGLVSGHVDGGETVRSALVREAREEAGIEISQENLKIGCVMHRKSSDRENIDFFIITDKWKCDVCNVEPDKCSDLKFFNLKLLPSNIIDYVKLGIEYSLNGVFYAEYGWND